MNALTKADIPEAQTIDILRNTFYIGAKVESVRLVLGYCRAQGLDPMLRPVHIVPMYNSSTKTMVDTVMPGIGLYRILAARTGQYAGKSEPEFGPVIEGNVGGTVVSYPEWCRVTVYRMVDGQKCGFTAMERWLENYATAKHPSTAPNAMWLKRKFGQIAKVAEAQALRMAFPEHNGGYTAEEMEGKGDYVDAQAVAEPAIEAPAPKAAPDHAAASQRLMQRIDACGSREDLEALTLDPGIAKWRARMENEKPELADLVSKAIASRLELVDGWDGISDDMPGAVSE